MTAPTDDNLKRARELYNGSLSGKVCSLETAYEYWAIALDAAEQRAAHKSQCRCIVHTKKSEL